MKAASNNSKVCNPIRSILQGRAPPARGLCTCACMRVCVCAGKHVRARAHARSRGRAHACQKSCMNRVSQLCPLTRSHLACHAAAIAKQSANVHCPVVRKTNGRERERERERERDAEGRLRVGDDIQRGAVTTAHPAIATHAAMHRSSPPSASLRIVGPGRWQW